MSGLAKPSSAGDQHDRVTAVVLSKRSSFTRRVEWRKGVGSVNSLTLKAAVGLLDAVTVGNPPHCRRRTQLASMSAMAELCGWFVRRVREAAGGPTTDRGRTGKLAGKLSTRMGVSNGYPQPTLS